MPPTDRPTSSRLRIREAARSLFPARGYAGTSVRDIAAAAGVDPALVIRYFGSKEQLFLDTVPRQDSWDATLAVPRDALGRALVDAVWNDEDATRDVFLALVRASDQSDVESHVHAAHEHDFVAPLRARLVAEQIPEHEADTRARIVAALLGGVLYARWIAGDGLWGAPDHDHVRERYVRLVDQALSGDLAEVERPLR